MPGRFPLYIDADIRGQVVEGLKRNGWDLLRAVDVYPERTLDPIHFKEAANRGRVLVGHDLHQLKFALKWLKEGNHSEATSPGRRPTTRCGATVRSFAPSMTSRPKRILSLPPTPSAT